MTRSIWARVFVAGLIFLGDWAFAAENRFRVEIEAIACEIATQVSQQTILDDVESSAEPAITGVDTTPRVSFTINQNFATTAYAVHGKLKYLPLHPRAPPQTLVC